MFAAIAPSSLPTALRWHHAASLICSSLSFNRAPSRVFLPVPEEIRSRHPATSAGSNVVKSAICTGEAAAGRLQITKSRGLVSDDQADWLLRGAAKGTVFSSRLLSTITKQGALIDREVRVTNFAKEDKGIAVLSGDVFDVPIRRDIVHRVVVWQLAKRRQGTHSTLTISEVSGTGGKPGPQKGSGRARHGTLRGPQFRGGANVFGPKPRDYEQGLQKKVRRLGLKVALSARLAEGKLIVFDNVVPPTPKTKDMVQILGEMESAKKVLFVEESETVNESLCRATKNIHYANVIPVKGLNVYSILQHETLVMTLSAVRALEDRLHTPINR